MQTATVKQVTPLLRRLLYLGSAFTFIAGVQLLVLARHTDQYFAWTVKPPITAAVLGAFFWGTTVFGLLSARERTWAKAHVGLPAALVFTLLTLAATLIHIDRFHLSDVSQLTRFLTYAWIAACAITPPLLLILLYLQLREPGGDPPRVNPLPGLFRVLLGILSLLAIVGGGALFFNPVAAMPLWGWDLTPLTARALGAWLIPVGIVAGQAIWENDWERVRVAMIGFTAMAVFELVAFGIFFDGVVLADPAALVWVGYCLLLLIVGGYGSVEALRASRWATGKQKTAEAA